MNEHIKKNKFIIAIIVFGISVGLLVIFPAFLYEDFDADWFNHINMINYYKLYIKSHHCFPDVINCSNYSVGNAMPVYYGIWFYRFMGIIALSLSSARDTLVVMAFIIVLINYYSWAMLFYKVRPSVFGVVIPSIIVCTIYQLTNLYNRGAIPEFFAVNMFSIVIAMWYLLIRDKNLIYMISKMALIAFLFAMIYGTHPITAMYGSIAFLVVIIISYRKIITIIKMTVLSKNWIVFTFAIVAICVTAVTTVVPWLYALKKYEPYLSSENHLKYYPGSDVFWVKLLPFPFTLDSNLFGTLTEGTPYLETQISIVLLVSFIVLYVVIIKNKVSGFDKYVCLITFGCATVIFLFSTIEQLQVVLPSVFRKAQFMYRLTSYVDIFLMISVLYAYEVSNENGLFDKNTNILNRLLVVIIALFVPMIMLKEAHACSVGIENVFAECPPNEYYSTYYFGSDYACRTGLQSTEEEIVFRGKEHWVWLTDDNDVYFLGVGIDDAFGDVLATKIECPEDGRYAVGIIPHPFNRLVVDDVEIPIEDTYYNTNAAWQEEYILVDLSRGEHILNYRFIPNERWNKLNHISELCMVMLCAYIFILFVISGIISLRKNVKSKVD